MIWVPTSHLTLSTLKVTVQTRTAVSLSSFFTYQLVIGLSTSVKLTLSTLNVVTVQTRAAVSLSSIFHLYTFYQSKYLNVTVQTRAAVSLSSFFAYQLVIGLSTSVKLTLSTLNVVTVQTRAAVSLSSFFAYQLVIGLSTSVKLTLSTPKVVTVQTRAAVSLSSIFHLYTFYQSKYLNVTVQTRAAVSLSSLYTYSPFLGLGTYVLANFIDA